MTKVDYINSKIYCKTLVDMCFESLLVSRLSPIYMKQRNRA
jgi:hypothetical protein